MPGVVGSIGGGWLVASLGYEALFIAAIAAALASALCAWQSRRLDSTAIG
jgi:predicted MFS family arabinose efflux permease